jgi:hypothetical protein
MKKTNMEQTNQQHDTLKQDILGKIKRDELLMRPKSRFVAHIALIATLAFVTFVLSVFICNFIFFHTAESGHGALLGFGPRGYLPFLYVFPWGLLLIDLVLIGFLQYLLRTFQFGYKRPGVYIALGIVTVIIVSGIIVSGETPFNRELMNQAQMGHLPPPIQGLYRQTHRGPADHDICRCEVVAVSDTTLTLKETEDADVPFTVFLPPELPHDFVVGEIVFIAGDVQGGVIKVFGIRKIQNP